MSAPMVQAILEGRKTQTRRIIKGAKPSWKLGTPQEWMAPTDNRPALGGYPKTPAMFHGDHGMVALLCPFGKPGDHLWVRETFSTILDSSLTDSERVVYRANVDHDSAQVWCPSIHMPRWASRITLEVTGVRVERLQDISEADAQAEGARSADFATGRECVLEPGSGSCRLHFSSIWRSIHGADSWDANPWVWVIEFRRVEQ